MRECATTNTTIRTIVALAEHAGYAELDRGLATTNTTIHTTEALAEHAEYTERHEGESMQTSMLWQEYAIQT